MAGERYTEEFKIAAVKQRKIEESRVRSCSQALRLLLAKKGSGLAIKHCIE